MKDQEVEQSIELVDGFQMEDEGVELSTSTTQRQPGQDGSTRARVEERDEQEDEIEYSGDYDGHQEEREESVKEITKEVEQKINIPNEDEEEELSTSTTPISFEKIGSRLFYIEPSNELNWYEAESFCQDNGGHLAAFENFEEYQAVRAKIRYFGLYWIGINDEAEEGVFVTSTSGEPAPFLKWYRNQPDSAGDEDCVQIYGYLDGMNDNICSKKMLFICQADEIAN
uniref:Accessory gland protein Acp29AB-like n=1 Tax=Drosophila rhopaloa TaxID=1041015 RepID=A0A6P4DW04_DRORH